MASKFTSLPPETIFTTWEFPVSIFRSQMVDVAIIGAGPYGL
uniref:Lycopene beta cyclase, chloroplast n=1 Tax=mine drainage metagenome TaxID=410659 RepID=E6PZ21_9ZZZZ